ncbi:hypothetical protein [uncultured Sphingomonas sp.]|mgnify:CR=1 FL=1|uniref:hypothetical protein n=1 Tax=uncultured Sphingomonas sp. TaxID=158754 RepID=UPI0025D2A726|nr:hypothetical protein [uncultured Sphingomonas sp.]
MVKIASAVVPVLAASLLLGGCGEKTVTLPSDAVEQAATCGVIAAATEREAAGVKGELPADAQARIFHYALLAGSSGETFDNGKADAVFQRMPKLFDQTIKGKWQTLRPSCQAAYPATQIKSPALPVDPLESVAQCYAITNFMRKALGSQGAAYQEAATRYGVLGTKLDTRLASALDRAGMRSPEARKRNSDHTLATSAKLGQPPAVIAACEAKYDS